MACTPTKVTPITGNYPKPPFIFESSSSFNTVWDKLIDLFAQKGLPIKLIDRTSGLLVSDRSVLPATYELNTGGLKEPGAFIVMPKVYVPTTRKTFIIAMGSQVTGEWNVRIREVDGKTLINVNIVNVRYEPYDTENKRTREVISTGHQSTGIFEKMVADAIR
ncbi:MAG: hypothetical protein DI535_10865 [Citrobacter freundii]|nr:MAG: hypothetical protein DI535_10865 [Citrobacter freundii]